MFLKITSKCDACGHPIYQHFNFESLAFEKQYRPYKEITAAFLGDIRPNQKLIPWTLKPKGFKCSNKKCRKVPDRIIPHGAIPLNDERLLDRVQYSSYKAKNVPLYEYSVDWLSTTSIRKKPKYLRKRYTGLLWTTTPRLKSSDRILNAFEILFINHDFIIVSTTMKGVHDKQTCFLIKVSAFKELRRLESVEPIILPSKPPKKVKEKKSTQNPTNPPQVA